MTLRVFFISLSNEHFLLSSKNEFKKDIDLVWLFPQKGMFPSLLTPTFSWEMHMY